MMKKLFLLAFTIGIFSNAFGQKLVNEKIFSDELNDTVHYRVWLPEDWNPAQKYAVIYTVEDSEDGMLAHTVGFYGQYIPATIVVGIVDGRGYIDYNFSTGLLIDKGPEFLNCLSKEIIPFVEQKYGASKFKAFMGHSYSASYANYLFLHHPGMFNAYILFAPERWWIDEIKPPFELDVTTKQYYNNHKTFYFLASAGNDLPRRQNYAKKVAEKLSELDTNKFTFGYKHIADAHHLSVVPSALAGALELIFKPYYLYKDVDSVADPIVFFKETRTQLKELYGLDLEKNNSNIANFSSLAATNKDKKAMDFFADYFLDDKALGLDLRNFAYSCNEMGYTEKAIELYERSITKSKRDELQTVQGPANLMNAYKEMALDVYKDNPEKGWPILERALKDKDVNAPRLHYYLGRLAADESYNTWKGLEHLLYYEKNNFQDGLIRGITPDMVSCKIAKCYLLLKDKSNAKLYLQKALIQNPDNEEAKELMGKL